MFVYTDFIIFITFIQIFVGDLPLLHNINIAMDKLYPILWQATLRASVQISNDIEIILNSDQGQHIPFTYGKLQSNVRPVKQLY